MLEVKELYGGYHKNRDVLKQISFQAEPGEFICILGANGCGKTTLLKNLLCLLRPRTGEILLDGDNIHGLSPKDMARRIAYIPQAHVPPFSYRVRDVVLMGRTAYLGRMDAPRESDLQRVETVLADFGLTELADADYTTLSGGQRQMVIIARALTQESRYLVMDEPTASLDYGNQQVVMAQMARLCRQGMCVIMVTHNPDHALFCADRAIIMKEGRILADGSPAETVNEENLARIYHTCIHVGPVQIPGGDMVPVCVPLLNRHTGLPSRSHVQIHARVGG